MWSIRISVFASIACLVLPVHGVGTENEAARRLNGSSESEIQSFIKETMFPLAEIEPRDAQAFFEELGRISGFNFILSAGLERELQYDTGEQRTYEEFFDETLSENGYAWRRQPGTNLIWISPDLLTQRFPLSLKQLQHLEALTGSNPKKNKDTVLRSRILGDATKKNGASFQRKGRELVVTDTQSNVRKVKAYLDRHNPRSGRRIDSTQQVLRSALYGNQSVEEAAAEGRVMYSNPEDGSITVIDTPKNLRKVDDYLHGPRRRSSSGIRRIYTPQHRTAADLNSALQGTVLYSIR